MATAKQEVALEMLARAVENDRVQAAHRLQRLIDDAQRTLRDLNDRKRVDGGFLQHTADLAERLGSYAARSESLSIAKIGLVENA